MHTKHGGMMPIFDYRYGIDANDDIRTLRAYIEGGTPTEVYRIAREIAMFAMIRHPELREEL